MSEPWTTARYLIPPRQCTPDNQNPFSAAGAYEPGFTGLAIIEDGDPFVGLSKTDLFHYKFRRDDPNIEAIVADFLRYENDHGCTPILFFPEDMDIDNFVRHALRTTPPPHVIRDTDPKYLLHSTSLRAGEQILRDQELKSFAVLSRDHPARLDWHGLRSSSLGEPAEYADQINLGLMDNPGGETVQASHAAGRFLSPDDSYTPGFRFYFDGHRIIKDKLDVRIAWTVKVRNRLPLDPYLVAAISVTDVNPRRETENWTPRLFTEQANIVFLQQVNGRKNNS